MAAMMAGGPAVRNRQPGWGGAGGRDHRKRRQGAADRDRHASSGPSAGGAGEEAGNARSTVPLWLRPPGRRRRDAGQPAGLAAIVALGGGPVRLIALVVAATAVCMLLARSFSAPLAKLRRATRQIAGGDLSVRVGNGLGRWRRRSLNWGGFRAMAASMEQAVPCVAACCRIYPMNCAPAGPAQRGPGAGRAALCGCRPQQGPATIGKESERLNELIEQC